ncbi:hypothetical protein HPB47_027400 [Ixodes persulcatus]|uniref:Uncharacterized protein n=1 Tax=Ixodes persulcatus TaxID=34615 RepID=A0AC60PXJ9_IXOPE|nr:hypothetical protein HPB47_027400 [Ixodes persulcatus]
MELAISESGRTGRKKRAGRKGSAQLNRFRVASSVAAAGPLHRPSSGASLSTLGRLVDTGGGNRPPRTVRRARWLAVAAALVSERARFSYPISSWSSRVLFAGVSSIWDARGERARSLGWPAVVAVVVVIIIDLVLRPSPPPRLSLLAVRLFAVLRSVPSFPFVPPLFFVLLGVSGAVLAPFPGAGLCVRLTEIESFFFRCSGPVSFFSSSSLCFSTIPLYSPGVG